MPPKTSPTARKITLRTLAFAIALTALKRSSCSSANRRGRSKRITPARPAPITTNQMEYLPKDVFHLFKQAARLGLVLNTECFAQFAQQFALALGQLARRLHPHLHVHVALA